MTAPSSRRPGHIVMACADLEVAAITKHCPGDAGELVGERDRQLVVVQPLGRGLDPGLEAITLPTHALHQHDAGGLHEQGAQIFVSPL